MKLPLTDIDVLRPTRDKAGDLLFTFPRPAINYHDLLYHREDVTITRWFADGGHAQRELVGRRTGKLADLEERFGPAAHWEAGPTTGFAHLYDALPAQ